MYTLLRVARIFYEIRQVKRNHPVCSRVFLKFRLQFSFYCGRGLVRMLHGVPETEMNDDCFHAESTVARRNAPLNADVLGLLRS